MFGMFGMFGMYLTLGNLEKGFWVLDVCNDSSFTAGDTSFALHFLSRPPSFCGSCLFFLQESSLGCVYDPVAVPGFLLLYNFGFGKNVGGFR